MQGHQVTLKLCPYAFSHYIKVNGMVPHGESELSPDEQFSGNMPNVGDLKIFGCRFYIIPPGIRRHKMKNNSKKGIFLVYKATSSQIYYWGMYTKLVNTSKHV